MSWTQFEHVLSMCVEYALNMSWTRIEHSSNTHWTRVEHVLNTCWTLVEHAWNTSWTCVERGLNTFLTRVEQKLIGTFSRWSILFARYCWFGFCIMGDDSQWCSFPIYRARQKLKKSWSKMEKIAFFKRKMELQMPLLRHKSLAGEAFHFCPLRLLFQAHNICIFMKKFQAFLTLSTLSFLNTRIEQALFLRVLGGQMLLWLSCTLLFAKRVS